MHCSLSALRRRPHGVAFSLLPARAGLSAVLCLTFSGTALALDQVQNEVWTLPEAGSGQVSVLFDAQVSELDLSSGIHFSIAVREGGGEPQAVLRIASSAVTNLPWVGEPVTLRVDFDLACNGTTVSGTPLGATARFCVLDRGNAWNPLPGAGHGDSTTVAGPFGLVVLDEAGNPGPNPTASTALHCATAAGQAPVVAAAPPPARRQAPLRILAGENPGTIGIFFDPEGRQCAGEIAPGGIDTVYVVAKLGESDDSRCGIAGAEFRFAGIPASWHTSPVLNHELLGIGDPFVEGVTLVAANCKQPASGAILLFTVLVQADAPVANLTFTIEKREPPTNSLFPCPLLLACDNPVFTKICIEGQPCFVNFTTPRKCPTPLAVQNTSWSMIKELYR